MKNEFFGNSKIPRNHGSEAVFDFLSDPDNVNLMIAATQFNLPAITGVVRELEKRFGNDPDFPLNTDAPNHNAPNRRNVGWMIRFIMAKYGYQPISEKNGLQSRIPASYIPHNSKSSSGSDYIYPKYFQTAARYRCITHRAERHIVVTSK